MSNLGIPPRQKTNDSIVRFFFGGVLLRGGLFAGSDGRFIRGWRGF